jgi:hypothetical protein
VPCASSGTGPSTGETLDRAGVARPLAAVGRRSWSRAPGASTSTRSRAGSATLLRRDAWRRRRDAAVESGREPVEAPGFGRLPARSQGRDRPHAPLRLCRAEPRRSRVLRPGRRSAGRFATMRGRPRRGRPPRARAPASARSRAARRPGPRAAPRRPKPLDRARRYEGGGASGSAGGSTTLLNLTVPSVRKIAVKPTITFTTVSVSFIPTLKARSVERATPTSRNA